MVAFMIQPDPSGECCVDPCSRSGPCDPCAYYDDHFNDFHDNDVHKYKFNDHNDRPELARMRRDRAGNSRLDDHFPTFRDPGNRNIYEKCGLLPVRQLEPRGNGQVHYLVVVLEQVAGHKWDDLPGKQRRFDRNLYDPFRVPRLRGKSLKIDADRIGV
jgi:hypothetical protein